MKKQYSANPIKLLLGFLLLVMLTTSCSKSSTDALSPAVTPQPIAKIALSEYQPANSTSKRLLLPISGIGIEDIAYYSVFDTGSTGMSIDATGILPPSMFTSAGIQITGDSVVINGITVTSKTSILNYGNALSSTHVYGNLAYATVKFGMPGDNQFTTTRIPFFIYYKVVDGKGKALATHSADVFGVGEGVSYTSNFLISSPLSYLSSPTGATPGFKLATTISNSFTSNPVSVANLLTIGLVPDDFASSSGFILHPLNNFALGGYSNNIPATVTYNGTVVASAQILFDTGTPSTTIIEDPKATGVGSLLANSTVSITTNKGFTFQYIVGNSGNLTAVQNPNNTGDTRTIFSLDFFASNEYMIDYKNHQIGLKNN